MKVAILDDYLGVALQICNWSRIEKRARITVFDKPFINEDTASAHLANFEVIVAMRERTPFPASLLRRLPALKLLVTSGMKNRSFDICAANKQSIIICGTGSLGQPTAELTWALILGLTCQIPAHDHAMKNGSWQTKLNGNLYGKTLGVLGLGNLGSTVARVGKAFGMRVIAWSPNLSSGRTDKLNVELVTKRGLMTESDYITIHLVLSDRTRGLVGAEDLELMKPNAYLINTSRGPIIKANDLLEVLRKKKIAGAGLDVYDLEPLPVNDPLRNLDNVLLTPHMGYVSEDNIAHMYDEAVEDIIAFLDGNPIRILNR